MKLIDDFGDEIEVNVYPADKRYTERCRSIDDLHEYCGTFSMEIS